MFGPYIQVLRRPGAARFSAAGMLARMQMSMAGLGAVMLLSAERGSFAVAGTVSSIYALSGAAISPQVSRLIDVRGQRRVVPKQLFVHVPAIAAIIFFAVYTELTWPILALALVAGASQPIIGPLVRTRWSAMLSGDPQLRTAFAWESLIDEAVFIIGPPLATVLALQLFPAAALVLATSLLLIGTLLLLTQHSTEPAPSGRGRERRGRPAILLPGVAGITAIFALMGGIFGSFEVTTVAFAKEAGHSGVAGFLLALYAFGSLLAGLIFGVINFRASLLRQFGVAIAVLAVVTLPMPFLPSIAFVGAGLMLAGVACSPALISGMSLVERIVPAHRLTETMSWTGSGMAVGIAVATPLAGYVIDTSGASTAYWVTSGCAIGAFLIALVVLASLRRSIAAAVDVDAAAMEVAGESIVSELMPALVTTDHRSPTR
ncbi:Predicted arabinose efflux permease, MFS family [Nakamurella panacisegetis]|uniref:Predicted arabinose efflux permease, MFS family n=1 Tax=Nakamurella panacisegetis TaxID=1090615 RepID=A0A1H0N326_9ACTN|nr:MFS transporter [Nakamurella panacisegetis]SDO86915.1 Predicted arabinose efflux permease, MFS family [Nakamurella panacisegetis]